jgi:hypothetical protein
MLSTNGANRWSGSVRNSTTGGSAVTITGVTPRSYDKNLEYCLLSEKRNTFREEKQIRLLSTFEALLFRGAHGTARSAWEETTPLLTFSVRHLNAIKSTAGRSFLGIKPLPALQQM